MEDKTKVKVEKKFFKDYIDYYASNVKDLEVLKDQREYINLTSHATIYRKMYKV